MSDRVREAIRADASTTQYADSVEIDAEGGRVVLRGVVEDLEDDDNLVAVASTVTGVAEVVDRLDVATL
jgi:osmotically-inducible protein OsmY